MKFIPQSEETHLPEAPTALLGLPSYGNTGQMAVDCLLASLSQSRGRVERLGALLCDQVLPLAGYEEFSPGKTSLCLPIEVYGIVGTSILLIQQRAPCIASTVAESSFAMELLDFCKSQLACRHVIALCGSNFSEQKTDNILRSDESSALLAKDFSSFPTNIESMCIRMPWASVECLRDCPESAVQSEASNNIDGDIFDLAKSDEVLSDKVADLVAGAPLCGWLLHKASLTLQDSHQNCSISAFGKFCIEGNNVMDAIDLAKFAAALFGIFPSEELSSNQVFPKFPKSWEHLFGPPLTDNAMTMF